MPSAWTLLVFSAVMLTSAQAPPAGEADPVVRPPLVAQPQYQSPQPRYCLLTFGEPVEKGVWVVHDGGRLYVDRNGNGDLTEPDEVFRPTDRSHPETGEFEFIVGDLAVGERVHKDLRVMGSRLQHLKERDEFAHDWEAADPEAAFYAVRVDIHSSRRRPAESPLRGAGIDGRISQIAPFHDRSGFLQFSKEPAEAPVIRFDAPWEVMLTDRPRLTIGRRVDVYLAVGTPGVGPGTSALIAYETLIPAGVFPEMKVTFPPTEPGMAPLETIYTLHERCCTVNLYG